MVLSLLKIFISVSACASGAFLKIDQSFKIKSNVKFKVIRNGTISDESYSDMEAHSPYCVIENLRLRPLSFQKKNTLPLKIKEIHFPNKEIKRFSLAETKNYSFYCDFTGKANFNVESINSEINTQLNPIMEVVK